MGSGHVRPSRGAAARVRALSGLTALTIGCLAAAPLAAETFSGSCQAISF
jgi:hypothetical protein